MQELTQMLVDYSKGDRSKGDQIYTAMYSELKKLAVGYMRKEDASHTLQATSLVNEAFCKLVDINSLDWQSRSHFLAMAATSMRRILIDHARGKKAERRGGEEKNLSYDEEIHGLAGGVNIEGDIDVLALNDAMEKLTEFDERKSKIVELRFFGGLSVEETASVLEIGTATVKREWAMAKSWLFREMSA